MKTYTSWESVPDNLVTKTTLSKLGLKLSPDQKPVAMMVTKYRSRVNQYSLFRIDEAQDKRPLSSAQHKALKKAQKRSKEKRTCRFCGYIQPPGRVRNRSRVSGGLCISCGETVKIANDRNQAIDWAKAILGNDDVVILDVESTGLTIYDEVVQIGIIDLSGNVLFESLIKPKLVQLTEEATAVHGITRDMLKDAPTFDDIMDEVLGVLNGKTAVAYNAPFDRRIMYQSFSPHVITDSRHPIANMTLYWECLMEKYAQFFGDWVSDERRYKWVSLASACDIEGVVFGAPAHTAVGDCLASLEIIKAMANAEKVVIDEI